MKKHVIKITSVVLSFVFLFSGAFSIMVSAEETPARPSCVEDHFSKLKYSNGVLCPPSQNTCAYVAMSMLLSYYDSYWRDDFIVPVNGNDLDWDQGVYNSNLDKIEKTFSATEETYDWLDWYDENDSEKDSYREFLLEFEDDYLENYLIDLGREWGYCTKYTTIYLMWAYEIRDYLNKYLHELRQFSENAVVVRMLRESDVGDDVLFETMEEQISNGNPVIYCGGRFGEKEEPTGGLISDNLGAHAMIAYGISGSDEDKDILLHTGWYGYEGTTVKNTVYQYFNSIIWLEINPETFPHECTDAYEDVSTGENVCACYIYSNTHPSHSTHNYHCNSYNEMYHCDKCGCGDITNIHYHEKTYSYYSSTQHYENCYLCGYEVYVSHSYSISQQYSLEYHKRICPCGAEGELQEHYEASYTDRNSLEHKVYCSCGEYLGTGAHSIVSVGLRRYCSGCGRIFSLDDNIPIIKNKTEVTDEEIQ